MHVAFLNSIEKETYGGMEEWIRLVSAGLAARGHRISLLGRKDSRFLARVGGSVPETRWLPLHISGDFGPIVISRIRKYLAEEEVDLLCVNFNKDVRLGGIAARLGSNIPVLWSLGMNIAKDKLSHRMLTPRLIDRIIVPSQWLKNELVQYNFIDRDSISVIPIGIEDCPGSCAPSEFRSRLREKYNLPDDSIICVTAARFVYKKGHEYLIDAAPEIIAAFPNVYFLFLGDGPKKEVHQVQIRRLGLSDRFIFAGMLDDVSLEMSGSDLMIHPAREEPFGIVLLEAMRAALPIAAARVGGVPEVVAEGETAVLFETCDSKALVQAVKGLLSRAERMKTFGSNGRRRWEHEFKYETMIDRVETAFMSAIGHDTLTIERMRKT